MDGVPRSRAAADPVHAQAATSISYELNLWSVRSCRCSCGRNYYPCSYICHSCSASAQSQQLAVVAVASAQTKQPKRNRSPMLWHHRQFNGSLQVGTVSGLCRNKKSNTHANCYYAHVMPQMCIMIDASPLTISVFGLGSHVFSVCRFPVQSSKLPTAPPESNRVGI